MVIDKIYPEACEDTTSGFQVFMSVPYCGAAAWPTTVAAGFRLSPCLVAAQRIIERSPVEAANTGGIMDLGQIAPLLSSINAVTTIARGMVGLRDEAMLQLKVNELLREIMSANTAAMNSQVASLSLVQQVDELKKKLAALEGWEREMSRYQLVDHGGETFTYVLKPELANGEPIHKLCTTCVTKGQKSILSFRFNSDFGQKWYRCDPCNREFPLGRGASRGGQSSYDSGLNWKTV